MGWGHTVRLLHQRRWRWRRRHSLVRDSTLHRHSIEWWSQLVYGMTIRLAKLMHEWRTKVFAHWHSIWMVLSRCRMPIIIIIIICKVWTASIALKVCAMLLLLLLRPTQLVRLITLLSFYAQLSISILMFAAFVRIFRFEIIYFGNGRSIIFAGRFCRCQLRRWRQRTRFRRIRSIIITVLRITEIWVRLRWWWLLTIKITWFALATVGRYIRFDSFTFRLNGLLFGVFGRHNFCCVTNRFSRRRCGDFHCFMHDSNFSGWCLPFWRRSSRRCRGYYSIFGRFIRFLRRQWWRRRWHWSCTFWQQILFLFLWQFTRYRFCRLACVARKWTNGQIKSKNVFSIGENESPKSQNYHHRTAITRLRRRPSILCHQLQHLQSRNSIVHHCKCRKNRKLSKTRMLSNKMHTHDIARYGNIFRFTRPFALFMFCRTQFNKKKIKIKINRNLF